MSTGHLLDVHPVSFRAYRPAASDYLLVTTLLDPTIYDTIAKRRTIIEGVKSLDLSGRVDAEIRMVCVRALEGRQYPTTAYQDITSIVISRCCVGGRSRSDRSDTACCTMIVAINPEGSVGRLWGSVRHQLGQFTVTSDVTGAAMTSRRGKAASSRRQPDSAAPDAPLRRSRRLSIMPEATTTQATRSALPPPAGRGSPTSSTRSRRSTKPASPVLGKRGKRATASPEPIKRVKASPEPIKRGKLSPIPGRRGKLSSVPSKRGKLSPKRPSGRGGRTAASSASSASSASAAGRRSTTRQMTASPPPASPPRKPALSPGKRRGRPAADRSPSFAKEIRARTLHGRDDLVVDFDVPAAFKDKKGLLGNLFDNPIVMLQTPDVLKRFSKKSQVTLSRAASDASPTIKASKDLAHEKPQKSPKSLIAKPVRETRMKSSVVENTVTELSSATTTVPAPRRSREDLKRSPIKRARVESRSPSASPPKKTRPVSPKPTSSPLKKTVVLPKRSPTPTKRSRLPIKQTPHPQRARTESASSAAAPAPRASAADAEQTGRDVPVLTSARRNLGRTLDGTPTEVPAPRPATASPSRSAVKTAAVTSSVARSQRNPQPTVSVTPARETRTPLLAGRSSIRRSGAAAAAGTFASAASPELKQTRRSAVSTASFTVTAGSAAVLAVTKRDAAVEEVRSHPAPVKSVRKPSVDVSPSSHAVTANASKLPGTDAAETSTSVAVEVAESAGAVTDSGRKPSIQNIASTPATKLAAPAAELAAPAAKPVTPATKLAAPAAKPVTPATKLAAPATEIPAPAPKMAAPSAKLTTPVINFSKISTAAVTESLRKFRVDPVPLTPTLKRVEVATAAPPSGQFWTPRPADSTDSDMFASPATSRRRDVTPRATMRRAPEPAADVLATARQEGGRQRRGVVAPPATGADPAAGGDGSAAGNNTAPLTRAKKAKLAAEQPLPTAVETKAELPNSLERHTALEKPQQVRRFSWIRLFLLLLLLAVVVAGALLLLYGQPPRLRQLGVEVAARAARLQEELRQHGSLLAEEVAVRAAQMRTRLGLQ